MKHNIDDDKWNSVLNFMLDMSCCQLLNTKEGFHLNVADPVQHVYDN